MAFSTSSSEAASSNTLIIHFKDWRSRHGELLDSATLTPIYTSEHRWGNPTFALHGPDEENHDTSLATGTRGTLSNKYALSIEGHDLELASRKKWAFGCGDVPYSSPAFGGRMLTWTSHSKWRRIELVCEDDQGQAIAKVGIGSGTMGWGRLRGQIEFVEGKVETEAQRDEVVATGLCLAYRRIMQRKAAAGAGASSGGMAGWMF